MTGKGKITAAVEAITPETARQMLLSNYGNRPIRPSVVSKLADEMLSGSWQTTHQGIAFSEEGRLIDGQHRLSAIVASGCTLMMMVTRGVADEAFKVTDRGLGRTLADVTRQDRRLVETCSFIARLHNKTAVNAAVIDEILSGCGWAVVELLAASGRAARGRTSAGIKAAASLRIMQGHKAYVLGQWRAFNTLEYAEMTPAVQSLCKQVTDDKTSRSSASAHQNDRAARAWIAFDPQRSTVSKIQVSSLERTMAEMRAVWQPSWVRS